MTVPVSISTGGFFRAGDSWVSASWTWAWVSQLDRPISSVSKHQDGNNDDFQIESLWRSFTNHSVTSPLIQPSFSATVSNISKTRAQGQNKQTTGEVLELIWNQMFSWWWETDSLALLSPARVKWGSLMIKIRPHFTNPPSGCSQEGFKLMTEVVNPPGNCLLGSPKLVSNQRSRPPAG